MSESEEYKKLLQEYQNLQLRVTKFSAVEQAMINIRDRLDSELEMHKRMQVYSTLALRSENEIEFATLTSESIVDIFETEMGMVVIDKKSNRSEPVLALEGTSLLFDEQLEVVNNVRELNKLYGNSIMILDNAALKPFAFFNTMQEILWYSFKDRDLGLTITILGMNSIQRAPLYNTIESRIKAIFSVFAQQGSSILANLKKSETIANHVEALTTASAELNKLSLIATKTQNGVIITNGEGKTEWVNKAFEDLYEFSLEEMRGKTPKELIIEEALHPVLLEVISSSARERRTRSTTMKTRSKSNREFSSFIEITSVFSDSGVVTNTVCLIKDVTQILEYQQNLEAKNAELKKINLELDNFVYSVSHDLRSPLLSIKGLLNLISMDETKNSVELSYANLALASVDRLDETIQEILDYSRNARFELNLSDVNIEEVIRSIFEDLRFAAEPPVHFVLENDGSPVIHTDKFRIETVLKNLIGNGFKFRKPGTADAVVKVSLHTNANETLLSVVDNGIGISEKSQPRIFEMFYRGSSDVPGTGLGLYICKEIVEKLHGTISATSEVGEGTTIKLKIPHQTNNK